MHSNAATLRPPVLKAIENDRTIVMRRDLAAIAVGLIQDGHTATDAVTLIIAHVTSHYAFTDDIVRALVKQATPSAGSAA